MVQGGLPGDGFAEGEEGQERQLEVFHGEGEADDGDGEDQAPCQMGERDGNAAYKPPDHVHNAGKATRRKTDWLDIAAERP